MHDESVSTKGCMKRVRRFESRLMRLSGVVCISQSRMGKAKVRYTDFREAIEC